MAANNLVFLNEPPAYQRLAKSQSHSVLTSLQNSRKSSVVSASIKDLTQKVKLPPLRISPRDPFLLNLAQRPTKLKVKPKTATPHGGSYVYQRKPTTQLLPIKVESPPSLPLKVGRYQIPTLKPLRVMKRHCNFEALDRVECTNLMLPVKSLLKQS